MLLSESEGQSATRRIGGRACCGGEFSKWGILKGTEVRVEKYAPLKDPMELVVKGYHVSLRVEEAARILVENVR
jgi:Fe2+ transport system protein FeoA